MIPLYNLLDLKDMLLNILKFLVFASIFINFTSAQTNKGITICEGKTSYISCSNNKAITIVRALFGRNKNNRECRIFSFFKSCSVFGNHTLRLVKVKCEGQQSCQLTASRKIFGDPCKYLKKYSEVVYRCVERQNLVPVMTTSTGNMDITIEDGIKDKTISIWILIFAIAGSLILSQFILVVCVVKLIKRKKKPTNKKDGVCKHLKREQLAVRKIQSEYQSEISTVSNHMYDALEPDEHSYISVI